MSSLRERGAVRCVREAAVVTAPAAAAELPGKSSLPSGESQDQHAGHDVMLTWEIALVPAVPSRVHGNTALKKYQPWPLKYALTIFFLT